MTNKSKISAVELTRDPLWIGDYALYQPKKGYRFTLDALLLGAVVPLFAGASLLEIRMLLRQKRSCIGVRR